MSIASMKNAPAAKPIVAVQKPWSSQALFTNSRKDKEIITPAVIPMRKPKDRLPGLRMIAINPPKPVPKPASKLSKTAFKIAFEFVIDKFSGST